MVKLNLGCGAHCPEGWINVDYAIGARLVKIPLLNKFGLTKMRWNKNIVIRNLQKTFPWDSNSVDVIYSSHTLEHFTREQGFRFLKECHRVLKPAGIIRIVVPDLAANISEYINGNISADFFIENLLVLYPSRHNFIKRILLPYSFFPHKCMYDNESLLKILKIIGFDVHPRVGFDSYIDDVEKIEEKDRTTKAVIVEGRKK